MRKAKADPCNSSRVKTRLGRSAALHIGISGWIYKSWRGVFYPPKLPLNRELQFASRALNTIEISGTVHSLQRPTSFQK